MTDKTKYILLIIASVVLIGADSFVAFAQAQPMAAPVEPYISVSPDIFYTLEDAFYLVGRSDPKALVQVKLTKQGELPIKFSVYADANGEWAVSEQRVYLSAGNWEVRAVQQVGAQVSGSSNPRIIRSIVTGIDIFGFQIRYVVIAIVVIIFLAILGVVFFYFRRKIKNLQRGLMEKQLRETEDRFHKGFAEIRQDLMNQLKDLASNSQGRPMTADEIEKRDHVLRELEDMERNLDHDIGDIGKRY